MRKAILCSVLAAAFCATSAFGGINTPKPMGPLNLYIDAGGAGMIVNDGATPFLFDGYTIASSGGVLNSGAITGIFDNALADMVTFPPRIGLSVAEALAWAELSTTANNYSEVTLNTGATLQPGDGIDLGFGFMGAPATDLTFTYVDSTTGGSWEGWWPPFDECDPFTLDGVGPFVWDIAASDTMSFSASVPAGVSVVWTVVDPFTTLEPSSSSFTLSWTEFQALGLGLGQYDLMVAGSDACGAYDDHTTTLTVLPEPTSMALLALGALAVLKRRRR